MKECTATESTGQRYLPRGVFNEYNGNWAVLVNLNPDMLLEIRRIIGNPITSLVIRNGTEGPERLEPKQVASFSLDANEPNVTVLTIASQVLDGRIQNKQKDKNLDIRYYKREFLKTLIQIITRGIEDWALSEIERNPNKKDQRFLTAELEKFMAEKREKLFIKAS